MLPNLHLIIEHWKWNPEYNVWVSTEGRVRNQQKKEIKIRIDHGGYCCVIINNKFVKIHRLVMMTWKPCANMRILTIDHLDHNKRHNALRNLEWVTKKENQQREQNDRIDNDPSKVIKIKNGKFTIDEAIDLIYNQNPKSIEKDLVRAKINLVLLDKRPRKYGGMLIEAR